MSHSQHWQDVPKVYVLQIKNGHLGTGQYKFKRLHGNMVTCG